MIGKMTGLLLALGLWTAAAQAEVRTLFVGINTYQYSLPLNQEGVHNLHGAVPDVAMLKIALRDHYGLKVDPLLLDGQIPASCPTSSTQSITLVNSCATRAGILGALRQLISASKPGDIVLFYYSGHGSSQPDRDGDQHRVNSTIVPYDARDPDRRNADILDVELRDFLRVANAGGVSVVTIFDSCSSGTATRDIADLRPQAMARLAPLAESPPSPPPPVLPSLPAPPSGTRPAYLVHLAAVADEGVAQEVPVTINAGSKSWVETHGVFTRALVERLVQPRGASYRDIADDVRRTMANWGETQTPQLRETAPGETETMALDANSRARVRAQATQAEGALDVGFLAVPGEQARKYPARKVDAATLALDKDGRLSGVTSGSTFAIYTSAMEAEAGDGTVIGHAVVTAVGDYTAQLTVNPPLSASAPDQLTLRETNHVYGATRLRMGIQGGTAAERAVVLNQLAQLSFIQHDDRTPAYVIALGNSPDCPAQGGNAASFRRADNTMIACIGPTAAPGFADKLGKTARAAANFMALASLHNDNGAKLAAINFNKIGNCSDGSSQCDFDRNGKMVIVTVGDKISVNVENTAGHDFFVYALFMDATNLQVLPLNAVDNNNDTLLTRGNGRNVYVGTFKRPGRGSILVLMTESPINIAALRQDATRDVAGFNDLEQLLLLAGTGSRGDTVPRTGNWGATLTDFSVK